MSVSSRRVFVFWTHPLFHETVRLLLSHPKIEWVGSSSNYSERWEGSAGIYPDTILVEEDENGEQASVIKILESNEWKVRVVGLNMKNNEMKIYHYVQKTVGKVEDLLQWILDDETRGDKE